MANNRTSVIFARLVEQVEFNLKAAKAEYFIRLPDGTIISNIDVKLPKQKNGKRNFTQPFGAYTNTFQPQLEGMGVAELREVSIPDGFEMANSQSAMINIGVKLWGKESVTTALRRADRVIEVLRQK